MLDIFARIFFSLKEKLSNQKGNFINYDSIPYSAFINKNALITKNGHIIYIIDLKKINDNTNDVRVLIKDALAKTIHTDDFAIWFQTVKIGIGEVFKEKEHLTSIEKIINKIIKKNENMSYKYVLKNFIFLVHNTENLSISNFKNIFNNFGSFFIHSKHNKYIESVNQKMSKISLNIIKLLNSKNIQAEILDIYGNINIIELLKFPFSFDYRNLFKENSMKYQAKMPIYDLSKIYQNIKLSFNESSCKITENKRLNHVVVFQIKDVSTLSHEVVKKILNIKSQNILITEVAVPCEKRDAKKYYQKQLDIEYYSGDVDLILKSTGISDAVDLNTTYSVEMQITFSSENEDEISDNSREFLTICKKYGIVAFFNDVDLERSLYLNLPSNFVYFEKKPLYSSIKDTCNFISLNKDFNLSDPDYLNSIYLSLPIFYFKLEKEDNYISFDLPKENPNIFIFGDNINAESNKIHNLLINRLLSSTEKVNIYGLSIDNSHRVLCLCHNGMIFKIQPHIEENAQKFFNPIQILSLLNGFNSIKREYFVDFFILLFSFSEQTFIKTIRQDLSNIFDKIIRNPEKYKSMKDLKIFFNNSDYENIFNYWTSCEDQVSSLFNAEEYSDLFLDLDNPCKYIDFLIEESDNYKKIQPIISTYIIYQVSLMNLVKKENRIISLSGIENLMSSDFYKYNFEKILNFANYCKVYFIFRVKDELKAKETLFDISIFSTFCKRFIFQANTNHFDFKKFKLNSKLNDILYQVNKFSTNQFVYIYYKNDKIKTDIVNIHEDNFYGYIENILNMSNYSYSEFTSYIESDGKKIENLKEDEILNKFYIFHKKRGFLA